MTDKERRRELRREAYKKAKAKRDADPNYLKLKEDLKQKRKEAYRKAKEKRDTDPRYQEMKERQKQKRREQYLRSKEQHQSKQGEIKKLDRHKRIQELAKMIKKAVDRADDKPSSSEKTPFVENSEFSNIIFLADRKPPSKTDL